MDHRDVIKSTVISEKSIAATAMNQFTFKVHAEATKTQIRDAVTKIFNVDVTKINTVKLRGKTKTTARKGSRIEGKRSDWKKATVTLKPGQVIELGGINYFQQ